MGRGYTYQTPSRTKQSSNSVRMGYTFRLSCRSHRCRAIYACNYCMYIAKPTQPLSLAPALRLYATFSTLLLCCCAACLPCNANSNPKYSPNPYPSHVANPIPHSLFILASLTPTLTLARTLTPTRSTPQPCKTYPQRSA